MDDINIEQHIRDTKNMQGDKIGEDYELLIDETSSTQYSKKKQN